MRLYLVLPSVGGALVRVCLGAGVFVVVVGRLAAGVAPGGSACPGCAVGSFVKVTLGSDVDACCHAWLKVSISRISSQERLWISTQFGRVFEKD